MVGAGRRGDRPHVHADEVSMYDSNIAEMEKKKENKTTGAQAAKSTM